MKIYIILSVATCLLTGCVTNPKKLTTKLTNAKYASLSEVAMKRAYDKDLSSCKQLALKNVPIPRSNPRRSYARKPNNNYAAAPSLLPMFEAMDRERNNPRNLYRASIQSYIGTCVGSKGWRKSG